MGWYMGLSPQAGSVVVDITIVLVATGRIEERKVRHKQDGAASRFMLDTCAYLLPLFICIIDVESLYLQQTCVFSLSIVLVMCSCNLFMELSRTFLFSYLSFCHCHLSLSVL